MPSAVFDFKDIRARMFGDLKPAPKPVPVPILSCRFCQDIGWVIPPFRLQHIICPACHNPEGHPSP
jgi:hypothetical protein